VADAAKWLTERADKNANHERRIEIVEWAILVFVIVGIFIRTRGAWEDEMDMIVLPTVIACPAAGIENLDLRSDTKPVLLRVQLRTETGQDYQLPLSARGAGQLLTMLSNLRRMRDDLFDTGDDAP
jgi:hypothetical protein